jgi:hypothetical protein
LGWPSAGAAFGGIQIPTGLLPNVVGQQQKELDWLITATS